MPRLLRVQFAGAVYHLMSRGDRREEIFFDDGDYHDFLKTPGEACQKAHFEIHAYCLMKNHFHLVLETPEGNLVEGMRWLLSTYSNRFNHRHNFRGHLFSGRYKALMVENDGSGYLRTACDYTHLNPVRAKLLRTQSRLLEYPWSSYGLYLTEPALRPAWLRVDRLLGEHGIFADTPQGRREFERRMEARREKEGDPRQWKGMRRGWCLGGESFRQMLLERIHAQAGPNHPGKLRQAANRARAEAIIAEELRRAGWSQMDLGRRAKTDAVKVALAARLRQETTMTVEQIASRLAMGTRSTLTAKLKEWRKFH